LGAVVVGADTYGMPDMDKVKARRWPSCEEIRAAKAEREDAERLQDVERSALFNRYSVYMDAYCQKHGRSPLLTFADFVRLVQAGKEPVA
jgi:hypothetical protein